jgi:hypothetical protein
LLYYVSLIFSDVVVYCLIRSGYCGEGWKEWHPWYWQEEVGTFYFDLKWLILALWVQCCHECKCHNVFNMMNSRSYFLPLMLFGVGPNKLNYRPICLCQLKAHQAEFWKGHLHICQKCSTPNKYFKSVKNIWTLQCHQLLHMVYFTCFFLCSFCYWYPHLFSWQLQRCHQCLRSTRMKMIFSISHIMVKTFLETYICVSSKEDECWLNLK